MPRGYGHPKIELRCAECSKIFKRNPGNVKNKEGRSFCGLKCVAKWNEKNFHQTNPKSLKNLKNTFWIDKNVTQEKKDKARKKQSEANLKREWGEKHYNWKGGISKNPYPPEFNRALKLKIRTRDNFTCCLCSKTEREELEQLNRVLAINHIDFDKNNCRESNLNTLCASCNSKINREREYWTNYFNVIQ